VVGRPPGLLPAVAGASFAAEAAFARMNRPPADVISFSPVFASTATFSLATSAPEPLS
jgi:hypothetical protein